MNDESHTTNQPLPSSVSHQNGEEGEPGQDGGQEGGGDGGHSGEAERTPADRDEHPSSGGAGEGSQSTGDPHSAG